MKKAFTFIEFLVVFAIIFILCGVMIGNVMKYKEERAKRRDSQVQGSTTQSAESTTAYTIISE